MPAGGAVITGVGALAGGASSFFGGKAQKKATQDAAAMQLQATRESISAQRKASERAFNIFQSQATQARKDLAPLRALGARNFKRLEGYLDPNSTLANQERSAYQKTLANNLSARGLTASGTELAGLNDFEQGLASQRRDLALSLAGIGAQGYQSTANLRNGLGQGALSLFGTQGQSIGNTLLQGASGAGNALLAQGQAQAQGLIGLGNAFNSGLAGIGSIYQNNQAQAAQNQQFNSLLGVLGGGTSSPGGGGGLSNSSYGASLNYNNPFG